MIKDVITTTDNIIIRPAHHSDLEEIRDIYNHFIKTSIYTMDIDEKSHEDMEKWLASHTERFPAFVAIVDNEIVGIASLSKWAERRGYYPSCEASIYLSPKVKAQGQGDLLLKWLIDTAVKNDFSTVISFMTSINKLARNLVTRNKFSFVGTMKNIAYKFNQSIDIDIYQYSIKIPDKNE